MLDALLYILFFYLIFAETFEVFCYSHFLIEEQLILVQVHSAASWQAKNGTQGCLTPEPLPGLLHLVASHACPRISINFLLKYNICRKVHTDRSVILAM